MLKTNQQANLEKLSYITAGTIVDVEVMTPTTSKRIKTEFVGQLNERFVILNFPPTRRLNNTGEYLKDGTVVIVRAVLESGGGQVIAFRQTILSVTTHPARLIFLNFPSHVQLFSLRSQRRIPTLLPAAIRLHTGSEFKGIIKDISPTGVKFEAKDIDALRELKNTRCEIMLGSNSRGSDEFSGLVCSVRNKEGCLQFGIRLQASEEEMKKFMKAHLIDLSILESPT